MPATWRWCAASIGEFPGGAGLGDAVDRKPGQCAGRPLRRSSLGKRYRRRGAAGHRASSTCGATRRHRGGFLSPRARLGNEGDAGARRAGAALPQPARLCAADAVPGLRPPLPVPGLLDLAGRAPLSRAARLPSLRPQRTAAGSLPRMRHARPSGRLRARRRAARRRGGRRCFPMRAPSCCRPTSWAASSRLRLELDAIAKGEADIVIGTQLVAKGHNFPMMTWSAWSMPISALPTAIRARPSGPSSCCRQVTGRAGATGARAGLSADLPAATIR